MFYDSKGQISLKISIFKCFPPCGGDAGIAEKENKAKNVRKISLTCTWFRSTAEKDAEDHGTMCLYRGTMGLRHSFTCPYQGQAFLCVKKWFEAQISGILPDVFSYISNGVCVI